MYRLKIIDSFSAAHQLLGYAGNCESLHGHNWKVEVQVRGEQLNDIGILIDFKELKRLTKGKTLISFFNPAGNEEGMELAKEKTQEIKSAYEKIKQSRA